MNRDSRPPKVVEWVVPGFMGLGFLLLMTAIIVFALSGNPLFIFLLWSLLGAATSVGLQLLARHVTGERRSYWMLIISIYVVVLLSGLALLAFFSEWLLDSSGDSMSSIVLRPFGAAGFYSGFLGSLGIAKKTFSPRGSEESL